MNIAMPVVHQHDAPGDPVIVIGPPRSGVRLLAAILDGHPRLASGPDLPCLVTIARQWQDFDRTLGATHARNNGLQPERRREAFRATIEEFLRPRLTATGKRRFVIQSFAAVVCPDLFGALFPQARIVLMLRDPRDVTASLLQCDWHVPGGSARLPCTTDARLAARLWRDSVGSAVLQGRKLIAAGRMMGLRYEDLCRSPATALERLGRFLGEHPAQALVNRDSAALVTLALHNPHPPLQAGAVMIDRTSRSSTELGRSALAAVESIGGELMEIFGYRAIGRAASSRPHRQPMRRS